jgi:hypothetical protein
MRIAVVYFPAKRKEKLASLAGAVAKGFQAQGHIVDLVDGERDERKSLTIYDYLAIGTEPASFFSGKLPERFKTYLKQAGSIGGKRSFGFVLKGGIGTARALARLMAIMESEGMFVNFSEILSDLSVATEIAKRLKVERV